MKPTIKMIAEKAGVSIGTVDRVLHSRPYVKEEVRLRVLRVMEELDYRPNRMASALATSATTKRLALIQPIWEAGHVRDEMHAGAARFLEKYRDYNVALDIRAYSREDEAQCRRELEEAMESGAQAVALCASGTELMRRRMEQLAQAGISLITFNSDIPGGRRLCYVGEDARRAGRIAGEIASHFLRPGEPFLVAYADPVYSGHVGRVEGFLERLAERGIQRADCRIAMTHKDYAKTLEAVGTALDCRPDLKLIYMANPSVPACVEALERRGAAGRIHVLCHDSGPEIQSLLQSGRVDFTIGQDLAYQPFRALELLLEALSGRMPEQESYDTPSPILNAETV